MNVPFFDLRRLFLCQQRELEEAILDVARSGQYILGEYGRRFEAGLVRSLGTDGFAAGCNSGTDAIVLGLKALGIGTGDEVITVSHTAIPTVSALCEAGAKPVFVDINPDTWLMDSPLVLSAVTPRTRAIVVVHLYGAMAPVWRIRDALRSLGREDISLLEDVAQAHGATWEGRAAGTIGDLGCFSFYPTKNIGALGDAGAVFTRAAEMAECLKELRHYGQSDRYRATLAGGINSRLDEFQAAILLTRLSYLPAWNARKGNIVMRYREELKDVPLIFQGVVEGVTPAWHLCVVRAESHSIRDRLMAFLDERGVQTLIHYPFPVHTQSPYARFARGQTFLNTCLLVDQVVSLPCNPCVTEDELSYVISCIREFFG